MDAHFVMVMVLLDIAVVVAAARVGGTLAVRVGQPAVLGEIAAGIALGPTLLGLFPGRLDTVLFPVEARGYLEVIAQLGLVLFMFIVGLEVDLSLIRGRGRAAGAIALGSLVLPLGLGTATATLLYPSHDVVDGRPVPQAGFALFLGVAMSITAMPVLARILTERAMHRVPTGVLAMASAAIDDVLGWALLTVVVAVAAGGGLGGTGLILALTIAFALFSLLAVRPLLARMVGWYERSGRLTADMLAVVLVGLLISAIITDRIGVHAIFGAFIFGVIMPRRGAVEMIREILERTEQISLLLLLPVFFVVAGLKVDVRAVGLDGLWQLGLVLAVAVIGKVAGGWLAARAVRMPSRQARTIGLLMNTRGLTELVILQVGVQLHLLDDAMYTMMVIMALVTTAMTGPLVRLSYPDRVLRRELAEADRRAAGTVDAYTVLVAVDGESRVLDRLAGQASGNAPHAHVVLCSLLRSPVQLELASGLGNDLERIAQVGSELRDRARAIELEFGVTSSVVARFSPDPERETAALAREIGADIVLAEAVADHDSAGPPIDDTGSPGPETAIGARVRAGRDIDPAGSVVALIDGTAAGRAAVRLGAQIALSRNAALVLRSTDGRRAARQEAAAAGALSRRGIAVAQDASGQTDVLVAPDALARGTSDGYATATLVSVHPDDTSREEEMEQVVERIAVERPQRAVR